MAAESTNARGGAEYKVELGMARSHVTEAVRRYLWEAVRFAPESKTATKLHTSQLLCPADS